MSRPSSPASGGTVPGGAALQMPSGDPAVLRARVLALCGVENAVSETPLLRRVMAQRLPDVWTGAAADAAVAESVELARRARRVIEALPEASRALLRYASALELARVGVARLQRQWDDETTAHTQAVATTRSQAVIDAAATAALVLLADDHEAVKSRLSRQHAQLLADLRAAAAAAARVVEAASERTFPRNGEPTGSALRDRLFAGMAFAEGAAGAARSRQAALGDAAALNKALSSGSSGAAAPSPLAISERLAAMSGRVDDPVYAQVMVDELGVGGIQQLVAELARSGSSNASTGREPVQEVTGLLGRLLLTATNPVTTDLDLRTERLVSSTSALLRDDVVGSLGGEVSDSVGGDRYAGYWLMGQLVSGARGSGWKGTLAPGFLKRLVAGSAQSEVAETHDADLGRQHGTTITPFGGEAFTSFFDDANQSGDALHVLLGEAGRDPVERLELLNTSFEGGILTDSRGGQISVAAYLSRRFVTYNANSPTTKNDLQLATTADLARLLRESSADGSKLAAALRGKVMAEVGRLSGYAQQGVSTANQYAANSALVENETVDWLLAMPDNVTMALNTPGFGMGTDMYAAPVGGGYQPALSVGETALLTGAFAVATDFSVEGKDPAANYQRLMTGSIEVARTAAVSGHVVDDDVKRMAFFDASASWALIGLARQQDAFNVSMWRALAEANHATGAVSGGPVAAATELKSLALDGSALTDTEKLVISMLRSNVELKQSVSNEKRLSELTTALVALRAAAPQSPGKIGVVMKHGSNRLTPLPTSEAVKVARLAEIDAALRAVNGVAGQPAVPALVEPALGHGATFVFDPLTGGSIDVSNSRKVLPHEKHTAEVLMRAGQRIEFINATGKGTTPDILMLGQRWELKSPTGNGKSTVSDMIKDGRDQASRFVIDLTRCPIPFEEAMRQVDYCIRRYDDLGTIWIITHTGRIIERKI